MIDLLPCPFCGGEARLTVHEGYHRASCFTCGNGTRAYADRYEAVRRWSRRVETAEESSGVGSVSEKEMVGEDVAMSELPNNCKRLREQLKKSLEREEQIERELTEAREQVAVLRGALLNNRIKFCEKFDNRKNHSTICYPPWGNICEELENCEEIERILYTTPSEAAERVNALVKALERISYKRMDLGGEIIPTEEAVWAMSALAQWRRQT